MRTRKELQMEIYKALPYTNQEQNEDVDPETVLETILFGRDRRRLERLIEQFKIDDEELAILKHRSMSLEEYNTNAGTWS